MSFFQWFKNLFAAKKPVPPPPPPPPPTPVPQYHTDGTIVWQDPPQ